MDFILSLRLLESQDRDPRSLGNSPWSTVRAWHDQTHGKKSPPHGAATKRASCVLVWWSWPPWRPLGLYGSHQARGSLAEDQSMQHGCTFPLWKISSKCEVTKLFSKLFGPSLAHSLGFGILHCTSAQTVGTPRFEYWRNRVGKVPP